MRTGIFGLMVLAMLAALAATDARAGDENLQGTLESWPTTDALPREADVISREPEVVTYSVDGEEKPEEKAERKRWDFELTIYLWMTDMDAQSTIDGVKTDVELDFSDIAKDLLEGAFSTRLEAWQDDFAILFSFDWLRLGENVEITGPGPIGKKLEFDVTVEQFDVFLGVAWRFAGDPVSTQPKQAGWFADLYGGVRYTSLEQSVEVKGVADLGGREDWFSPVIGLRGGYTFGRVLTLAARLDAGGFGISELPDRDIILLLDAQFRVATWFEIRAGYQWRWFDYSTGSGRNEFGLEADYGGPWLGLTFRF